MKSDIDEHNALYQRATELVGFTTTIVPPVRLSWIQRWKVRRGIRLLERVVQLNPENWAALWVMGKAHQATGNNERALDAFSKSNLINPDHPDVAREASISAMECSRHDAAIAFAERAMALNPSDSGLHANLALAYLLSGQPQIAKVHVEQAYAMDSRDKITEAVRQIIDEVMTGKRPCPRHSRDI
jgi:tetratricopeptide (TPR) repeat protein